MRVMMFNTSNLDQQEVDESSAKKLEDLGWVRIARDGANTLVHMYHPGYNKHINVLKADQATWENKGYWASPTVLYHPEEGVKTVPAEQAKRMLNQGWYDSPAKFPAADKTSIVDKAVKDFKEEAAEAPSKAKKAKEAA